MRRIVGLLCAVLVVVMAGCSGDVSRATIRLGASDHYSRAELQAAADAVLEEFRRFKGCTLLALSYDEEVSERQEALTWPRPPDPIDVVIFTSDFSVDGSGSDGSLTPNSTYRGWSWEVTRPSPDLPWKVTNHGMA